ncbi:MAG: cell division protein ZapD [Burkholderiaceae bacterium]|nr:MAG: cell division protein ZapD [Burkholderiaceae bacterium]
MILYEYPFNERIRTLLRLEDLFDKFGYFVEGTNAYMHHTALVTLFEILDVAGRADLKADLLQELERQRHVLMAFRSNPDISEEALTEVLGKIERIQQALTRTQGKPGQTLRDNEWLMNVRSRTIIPGGACEFDLPSYYAWQQKSCEKRKADLDAWVAPMLPLRDAMAMVLHLLRESGQKHPIIAAQGGYQQMLGGKHYHMLQVRIAEEQDAIPEISANKYMLWIRFTRLEGGAKAKTVERDIPFELTLCNL